MRTQDELEVRTCTFCVLDRALHWLPGAAQATRELMVTSRNWGTERQSHLTGVTASQEAGKPGPEGGSLAAQPGRSGEVL